LYSQDVNLQTTPSKHVDVLRHVWAIINKQGFYAGTRPVAPKKGNQLLANIDVNKRPANNEVISQA
jgi:hypothetical protein